MLSIKSPVARIGTLAVSLVLASPLVCSAATIRYQSDAELIAASSRIVRGRVLSSSGERDPRGQIYTVTTIEVLEDFSGFGEPVIEVRELGGTVGRDFLYVGGAAQYVPGSEVVVCLERSNAGHFRSVSMGFSKFDVMPAPGGDPVLRRNLAGSVVVGGAGEASNPRLSSFRELAERLRGVRSMRPVHDRGIQPRVVVQPFTLLDFGDGRGARWTEADSGAPVRWFIDTSAPPPVPSDASGELQTALAGWTNPPGASIVLAFGGFTNQTPSAGPWASLGAAGVVFFEDPDDQLSGSVLAIGGGWGTEGDDGGVINGIPFRRFLSGFVIFQNAANLSSNFHEARDFTRVLMHEVGHGIGLGHTQTDGSVSNPTSNIMYASCCHPAAPIAPSIGPDDLAGVTFIYPAANGCTYSLSTSTMSVSSLGSNFDVNVDTQGTCAWNVSGVPSWITASPTSGTGNGPVHLSIAANRNTSQRMATLLIGGRSLSITQQACACTVSPTSASVSGRGGTVVVSVSSSACQWSASSPVTWIRLTAGAGGTGNGSITLTVDPNTQAARTAVVTVASRSVTITQAVGTGIAADFNGDGRSDLVWHHQVDGRISVWLMNGLSLLNGVLLTPDRVSDTDWKVVSVWDPDGNGSPDLLWRHATSGSLATWRLQGTTRVSGDPLTPGAVPDTAWEIVAVADMDRDGDQDLVWQHRTQGLVSAWLMNGTTLVDGHLLSPSTVADTNWRIVGSGDFNNDGHADLIWQHRTTGQASVWFMNGTTLVDGTLLSPPGVTDTNWQIRAVTDLDGNGHADLVWQNVATGYLAAWLMNGIMMVEGVYLSPNRVSDTGWRMSGPR